jgi:hypothetical protein
MPVEIFDGTDDKSAPHERYVFGQFFIKTDCDESETDSCEGEVFAFEGPVWPTRAAVVKHLYDMVKQDLADGMSKVINADATNEHLYAVAKLIFDGDLPLRGDGYKIPLLIDAGKVTEEWAYRVYREA